MSSVPWLRAATPYRDKEVERLKQLGYSALRSQMGSETLEVSADLQSIGCCAVLTVTENKRKVLTVTVTVVSAATASMTVDGFTITPRGKITPLYTADYDD